MAQARGRTPTRYDIRSDEHRHLRREAGQLVKSHRKAAGLSQMELSKRLNMDYYTFISQVETGARRLPTEEIEHWARALEIRDVQSFARALLRCYDPLMYELCFGGETKAGTDA